MFRPYDQSQQYLLPPRLQDFVDESHPAHVVNYLVDQLDLSVLETRYGNLGQPAYHPRLMLKVILYGFTVGIFSSHKLQRACQENLAFKYLAGMETPVFRTFIEFRQRHLEDMNGVFVQMTQLARELGLVRLSAVALDGSKVEADTSKHKAMSYGRMQDEEAILKAEIEGLVETANAIDEQEDFEYGAQVDGYSVSEELERRAQRLTKIKKAQAALDMDSQIIVANHIEDSVSDARAAEPVLERMEQNLGLPGKLVADAGYGNKDTLESCQERGVTRCAPRGGKGRMAKRLVH